MALLGRMIPAEHLAIQRSMGRAHLVIALCDPDIALDPQIFLPELVDQPGKGQRRPVLHIRAQRPDALRVVPIAGLNIGQAIIPNLQHLVDHIEGGQQFGFGMKRHGIRRRQCRQDHPRILGRDGFQTLAKGLSQMPIARKL